MGLPWTVRGTSLLGVRRPDLLDDERPRVRLLLRGFELAEVGGGGGAVDSVAGPADASVGALDSAAGGVFGAHEDFSLSTAETTAGSVWTSAFSADEVVVAAAASSELILFS